MAEMAESDTTQNETPGPVPAAEPSESKTATATQTAPRPGERSAPPKVDRLPPFRVLLHNDQVNDMIQVVDHLVSLTPLPRERAVNVMLEAHRSGVSLVLVTHKERAELYQDQFRSVNLRITIEPAEG